MGKPDPPCFKKIANYLAGTPTAFDFPIIPNEFIPIIDSYDEKDFFILPISGVACPSIILDEPNDLWINPDINLNEKIQFLCISDRYDPDFCSIEVDKHIRVADINIQTNRCKRYRLRLSNISFPTTTTTTTLPPITTTTPPTTTIAPSPPEPDIILGNNSANWEQKANWDGSTAGNITTVGSNGRASAYGTYDQSGNILEFTDNISANSKVALLGGAFSDFNIRSDRSRRSTNSNFESPGIGFRIATTTNPLNLNNFVFIGDANNQSDTTGYGKVDYNYRISKYTITNCEYVNFLNSVDPQGINPQGIVPINKYFLSSENFTNTYNIEPGIIFNNLAPNGKKYSYKINMANKPVNFISWFSSARYCNWLHNGKRAYSVTDASVTAPQNYGAYNIGISTTGNTVIKQFDAKYYIPNENEWYKAAYYKKGGTNAGYWTYATQSDTSPASVRANSAGDGILNGVLANITDYSCPIITESVWIYPLGYSTSIKDATISGSATDWTIRLPESATGLEGGYTILINGAFRKLANNTWGLNLSSPRIRYQDGSLMDTVAPLFCVVTNLPNSSRYTDMTLAQLADFYNSAIYIDFFKNHVYYPETYAIPDHSSTIPTQAFTSSSWGIVPASSPIFLKSNTSDNIGRRTINLKFNKPVSSFPAGAISLYWHWPGDFAFKPLSYWQTNLPAGQYTTIVNFNNFLEDYKNRITNA
jgi:formylglycine-generating enzyme required for sulfatase activity